MKYVPQYLVTTVSLITIGKTASLFKGTLLLLAIILAPLLLFTEISFAGGWTEQGVYAHPGSGRGLQNNIWAGYGTNRPSLMRGRGNTGIGHRNLRSTTTGSFNTAIGTHTLQKNTTGHYNTASGFYALKRNTTGHYNTASGGGALRDNKTGSKNTGFGYRAGGRNINGSRNVFIGYEAGYNNFYITKSNKLVIANGPRTINQLITGDFRALKVDVGGSLHVAVSLTQGSDGRLKKDIKPLTHALDAILQLQGKTYRWKEDTAFANKKDIGLVAQEVEKVFPELVAEDERGYKGIAYSKLTAVLIEAIKEQQQQFTVEITALQKENTQLKTIMAEQMEALLARVAMLEGVSLASN